MSAVIRRSPARFALVLAVCVACGLASPAPLLGRTDPPWWGSYENPRPANFQPGDPIPDFPPGCFFGLLDPADPTILYILTPDGVEVVELDGSSLMVDDKGRTDFRWGKYSLSWHWDPTGTYTYLCVSVEGRDGWIHTYYAPFDPWWP